MSVLVDSNRFASLVNKTCHDHDQYIPIMNFILYDRGKFIVGGTKFKSEIEKVSSFGKLLKELSRYDKVKSIPDEEIDRETQIVKSIIDTNDFDDPHLFAIIRLTNCKIFCTNDGRTFKYFKNRTLVPSTFVPKIYTTLHRNPATHILNEKNLCAICAPHTILEKDVADMFGARYI